MKEIQDLIEISRYYGRNKDYTLAGGGNTSYKNDEYIWVKASGATLATIDEEGFAQLYRDRVKLVGEKSYSNDEQLREVEVKNDLIAANVYPEKGKRPSVETSLHELIEYAFVIHMHPTHTNSLMCAKNSEKETLRLFGEEVLYVGYDPGYALFIQIKKALVGYRERFAKDPKLIFLENHGIFVSADSIDEIRELYDFVTDTIKANIANLQDFKELPVNEVMHEFLPAARMLLSEEKPKSLFYRHSDLHKQFYTSVETFEKAHLPFTPDIIVYCKSAYLYLENSESAGSLLEEFRMKLDPFIEKHGFAPKLIMVKDAGLVAAEETAQAAEIAMEVYEDLLKVSYYSESFGGPRFMTPDQIAFIDNWEVENYRRKISKGEQGQNLMDQKVVVVTGAAQGFGEGIAENLVRKGANVVIADLNREKGQETVERLRGLVTRNKVTFEEIDVSDPDSVMRVVESTVRSFGGIDVFISNAGILYAGAIDELSPAMFSKMTEVNYNAWFYCVRAASKYMKLQSAENKQYTMDLIQINSKSGLQGSNRNFAYAGGKFGGIGLTQSFAMELAPDGIKVNSICPGNFFEGPLWADPEKGLFVQYLNTGKVPGAKTIDDVKAFYESKVPLNRGCRVEDVMKAIYYIIDQQYETGQAIPVTGGQVMLR